MNELDLFAAALAIADPAERTALLDRECTGQPALRDRLKQLLDAHARSNPLLDQPVPGPDQTGAFIPSEQPGTIIAGRYKLLEQIGEGGMGSVWVAEQTQPVRRKVALKLIKAGMDSKSVLARFEAERQALAVMDHPNIAKVLDGGLTENGRPFFVMEYVKGVPITEYCDATRLSVPERLNLFVQVCHAVQHAHQKGIIHRDLKPSNILVAPYDDKPVPKVIDFGLAKAMHQSLTERTLHTAHETVLGTPLYMSPEQAQLNNLDVDTRSDIYSLGVLLYELLTGTTPLEKQRFKEAAWDEIKRIIREEEPPRPSTRLSSSNTLASLAAGRHSEPAKLTKLVRGELDWIVMKSLEKDRTRRYDTANGFAMDVQRYLAGEPVLAVPHSATYRLRKFARKHRRLIATVAGFAALLILGTAVSIWQAVRATNAEGRARHDATAAREAQTAAREAQTAAEQAQKAEAKERAKARKQAEIAEAVKEFLETDLIAQANVFAAVVAGEKPDPDLKLGTAIDRAAKKISERFNDQPLLEASVRRAIASSYVVRGLYYDAQLHLELACELYRAELDKDMQEEDQSLESEKYIEALMELAEIYFEQGQLKKALARIRTAEVYARRLAEVDPDAKFRVDMLVVMREALETNDLSKAMAQMRETFKKLFAMPPDAPNATDRDPVLDPILDRLAENLKSQTQPLEMMMEALNHIYDGKHHEAERVLKQLAVRFQPKAMAELNVLTLDSFLGEVYFLQGKYAEALTAFETARAQLAKWLGADHPMVGASRMGLGQVHLAEKRFALAEAELRAALSIFELRTPDHYQHFYVKNLLGAALAGQKKIADAEPLLKSGYEGMKARSENIPKHEMTRLVDAAGHLVAFYDTWGKPEEAVKWRKELAGLLADARTQLPKDSPELAGQLTALGLSLLQAKVFTQAEPLLRESLAIREKKEPDAWATFDTKSLLGGALLGQKKYADAEPLLLAGYEGMKQREKTIPPQGNTRIPEALDRLIDLYTATNKSDEVKKWQAERAKNPELAPLPREKK